MSDTIHLSQEDGFTFKIEEWNRLGHTRYHYTIWSDERGFIAAGWRPSRAAAEKVMFSARKAYYKTQRNRRRSI